MNLVKRGIILSYQQLEIVQHETVRLKSVGYFVIYVVQHQNGLNKLSMLRR